ncbi:MAG: hypothetical protein IKH88_06115 [Prevotella sp.]|nr:hypothetical protein [Prevotella sp.]
MNILTPKALPWAMCLLAFQAALRIQADNHFLKILPIDETAQHEKFFDEPSGKVEPLPFEKFILTKHSLWMTKHASLLMKRKTFPGTKNKVGIKDKNE